MERSKTDLALERALRAARIATVSLTVLALQSPPTRALSLLAALALVFGWHLFVGFLASVHARSKRHPRLVACLLLLSASLPLAVLPGASPTLLLFALGSALFELAFHGRAKHRHALLAAAIPMAMAALLLQLRPSLPILFLAPLAALCSTSAGLFLHRRSSREAVRAPARMLDHPGESRRRLIAGLPLGILLAITSLAFFLGGTQLGAWANAGRSDASASAAALDLNSSASARNQKRDDARNGSTRSPQSSFDSHIGFGGGVFPFSTAEVLRLRPEAGQRVPKVVYLRGVVLDRIEREGVAVSSQRRTRIRTDAEDGRTDGWTHVRPRQSAQRGDIYHVDGRVLSLEGSAWTPLFAAEPLTAVQLPRIAYEPDRGLLLPDSPGPRMRYTFEVANRYWSPRKLRFAAARHPIASTLQLPRAIQELPGLSAFLDEACKPGQSDWEQVTSIVRSLRTEFTYERLETGFEGIAALGPFLEQRRGFCTHFATMAVVALRTQGLSARIATGFLAHEWDPEAQEFVVRDKHAHAWIEVYFEDVGWVPFDPTPAQEGRPELTDGYATGDPAPQGLADAMQAWLGSPFGRGSLSEVFVAAAGALWSWSAAEPGLAFALLIAALLLGRLLSSPPMRTLRPGGAQAAVPKQTPESAVAERLVQALQAAGVPRRRGQTLLALAREAELADKALAGAVSIARRHYAIRWGGAKIDARSMELDLRELENLPLARDSAPAITVPE